MSRFWPFRGASAPEAEADPPPPFEFHSRGLEYVVAQRPRDRPWSVLDLGPANNSNLHFFVGLGARYVVEDLWRTIAPCRSVTAHMASCLETLPDLLAYEPGTGFDLVLAWDLLDHLDTECLAIVGSRLAPGCRSGCLMHSLVTRSERMPGNPLGYTIVDNETIRHPRKEPPATIASPQHTDATLVRSLAPWSVDKTFLLKHGVQEHIFERPIDGSD